MKNMKVVLNKVGCNLLIKKQTIEKCNLQINNSF